MKNIDIIESAEIEETTKELNDLKKWIEKQKGPKLTRSAWRIKWPSGEETWYNMPMDTVVSYGTLWVFKEWLLGTWWLSKNALKLRYGCSWSKNKTKRNYITYKSLRMNSVWYMKFY